MLLIAIDGACRRNGKPDCVAAGGLIAVQYNDEMRVTNTTVLSDYEIGSTNQRGEMLALIEALQCATEYPKEEIFIVTDSEYLFNAMRNEWPQSWSKKGWVTASGSAVKNRDLWEKVLMRLDSCRDFNIIHIKGHVIPFGKVTAQSLLLHDGSGFKLLHEVFKKYDMGLREDVVQSAQDLSKKNNGGPLDPKVLRRFVVTNVVADAIATRCVEKADMLMS